MPKQSGDLMQDVDCENFTNEFLDKFTILRTELFYPQNVQLNNSAEINHIYRWR